MSSTYHNDLIKIQTKNLFDVPLDVETSFDSGMDMSQVEIGAGTSPFTMMGGGRNRNHDGGGVMKNVNFEMDSVDADFDEVDLNNINDAGQVEFLQKGGNDPQLFDKIELQRDDSSSSPSFDKSNFTEMIVPVKDNIQMQSGGGGNDNIEMEIEDLDLNEVDIDQYGNVENPGEDAPNADDEKDKEYDTENIKDIYQGPPPKWVHPELTIENDDDMINKMNQEEVDAKVAMYVDYYNSDEYSQYLKYFQMVYSASHQKYSIRRDVEGNIYLIKRHQQNKKTDTDDEDEKDKKDKKKDLKEKEKENKKDLKEKEKDKGKKTGKETVQDIINDTGFKKNYMIKLTPPEYLNIETELSKITNDLNVLSGEIKLMQNDLIELGMDIKPNDIKHFEKIKNKFYKLINRKAIYSRYFYNINNLSDTTEENPEINNIFANELIGYEDKNDVKAFKLKSNIIRAPTMLIDNIILQLKDNLENFAAIIQIQTEENKDDKDDKEKGKGKGKAKTENNEYESKIKTFLINKKINDTKTQKELDSLVNFSKAKVNFIIKKLPVVDVKTEPN
jgi:hypothetical protein